MRFSGKSTHHNVANSSYLLDPMSGPLMDANDIETNNPSSDPITFDNSCCYVSPFQPQTADTVMEESPIFSPPFTPDTFIGGNPPLFQQRRPNAFAEGLSSSPQHCKPYKSSRSVFEFFLPPASDTIMEDVPQQGISSSHSGKRFASKMPSQVYQRPTRRVVATPNVKPTRRQQNQQQRPRSTPHRAKARLIQSSYPSNSSLSSNRNVPLTHHGRLNKTKLKEARAIDTADTTTFPSAESVTGKATYRRAYAHHPNVAEISPAPLTTSDPLIDGDTASQLAAFSRHKHGRRPRCESRMGLQNNPSHEGQAERDVEMKDAFWFAPQGDIDMRD